MLNHRWSLATGVLLLAVTTATSLAVPRSAAAHVVVTSRQAAAPATAGATVTVSPARIADSRLRLQIPGALGWLGSARVQVTGRGGIPAAGVAAAVLNVTVVAGAGAGYVTVWPSAGSRPGTSSLNFDAGQTIANGSAGAVHVVIDVTGYVVAGAPLTASGAEEALSTRCSVTAPCGLGAMVIGEHWGTEMGVGWNR